MEVERGCFAAAKSAHCATLSQLFIIIFIRTAKSIIEIIMERRRRLTKVQLWILLMAGMVLPRTLALLPFLPTTNNNNNNHPRISPSDLYLSSSKTEDYDSSRAKNVNIVTRTTDQTDPSHRKRKKKKHVRRKFDDMFPKLAAFQKKHGHTLVSKDQDRDLYRWTKTIRNNYLWQVRDAPDPTGSRKRLNQVKLQMLQEIGFSWETKRNGNRWPTMLQALIAYKGKYNTTQVDATIDRDLHDWTRSIRNNYRHQALNMTVPKSSTSKRRPRLASTKLKALNDIGFDWGSQERQEYLRWPDMIRRLETFYAEYGHSRVPKDHEDRELYRWSQNLITNYGHQISNSTTPASVSGRRHFLSPRRLQQLRELDFGWDQRSAMWERNYQELCDFRKKNGHCHVTMLDDRKLSVFVQNQRREYRYYLAGNATTLTSERMEALQRIGFEWARPHAQRWKERHQELQDFYQNSGTANVPQDFAANFRLGQWTMNQRTKYRQRQKGQPSGLTDERIRELEKLEFQWSIPEMQWHQMYERLKKYQEENGHLDIYTSDEDNSDLRQWVNLQRHLYRKKNLSRLSKERIALLESISGFGWRNQGKGLSKDDWSDLFVAIREKGIVPGTQARRHWFDGTDRFSAVKTEWTEQELLALWNEDEDDDEDEGEFFEDEESRMFLRA